MTSAQAQKAILDTSASWRRSTPALLLVAYFVAMPIQFEWGATRQIAPADIFIAAYLFIRAPQLRHVAKAWTPWQYALAPLFAFGMLVSAFRIGEITSYALLQKGLGLLVLFGLFTALVDFMQDRDRVIWLLRVFVGAVLLHATVALGAQLLVYIGGPTLPLINEPYPGQRISGLVLDANAFGGLLALAFVLHHLTVGTPAALLRGKWALIAYLVLPTTLLLTFSRSSWMGLAIGLFAIVLLRPWVGGRAVLRVVIPALVVVPLVLAAIPNSMDLVMRPGTTASRVAIGEVALDGFLENPIIGLGLGVYIERQGIVVHNTMLWFLSDLGAIGLVVFLAFIATVAVRLVMVWRLAPAEFRSVPLALLCGHIVMFGVSFGIEAFYQRHWWLVFAAAGAAYAVVTTRPAVPSPADGVVTR
jgi:O-antigen ligase